MGHFRGEGTAFLWHLPHAEEYTRGRIAVGLAQEAQRDDVSEARCCGELLRYLTFSPNSGPLKRSSRSGCGMWDVGCMPWDDD